MKKLPLIVPLLAANFVLVLVILSILAVVASVGFNTLQELERGTLIFKNKTIELYRIPPDRWEILPGQMAVDGKPMTTLVMVCGRNLPDPTGYYSNIEMKTPVRYLDQGTFREYTLTTDECSTFISGDIVMVYPEKPVEIRVNDQVVTVVTETQQLWLRLKTAASVTFTHQTEK